MLKIKKKKRITTYFIILLMVLFIFGSTSILQAITSEECMEGYSKCVGKYLGVSGFAYCGLGYAFCLLYL